MGQSNIACSPLVDVWHAMFVFTGQLEGCIQSIDARKARAKVSLSFLGEMRTVDLGVNILRTLH